MELKTFFEKAKLVKDKNVLLTLTHTILKLEEHLIEGINEEFTIDQLGDVLKVAFIIVGENKIDINNSVVDLDLDNWKNSIRVYRIKNAITKDVFLYTLRNSLKNLIEAKDANFTKLYIFEIIIKTFLYIDFLGLSIDTILEKKMKSLVPTKEPVIKEKVEKIEKVIKDEQHKEEKANI